MSKCKEVLISCLFLVHFVKRSDFKNFEPSRIHPHVLEWLDWKWTTIGYMLPGIQSDNITEFGHWSRKPILQCPLLKFRRSAFIGFRLRTERPQGWWDDSAVNALALLCGGAEHSQSTKQDIEMWDKRILISRAGRRGDWGNWIMCPPGSYIKAFNFRHEINQGIMGDDTAINNLKIRCGKADNSTLRVSFHEGDGTTWGYWTGWHECPDQFVMCQMKTLAETSKLYYPCWH